MRAEDSEKVRARIYFGEADKWHHQPLETALLERLRREGYAGATAFHGVAGFGAGSVMHTAHLLELSADLPVVIEVIDTSARIESLLAILDAMLPSALVTVESVRAVRYATDRR